MIERATTCLENGGKHVLRIPKKSFRTKRSLHSSFWSHGAGDINLPAWWHAFLRVSPTSPSPWPPGENPQNSKTIPSHIAGLGFLDFLYPVRTLAFIRRHLTENTTALRRHPRSRLLSQRSRTYASTADSPVGHEAKLEADTEATSAADDVEVDFSAIATSHLAPGELAAKLHEMLFSEEQDTDIRVIWQLYEMLQESSGPFDPSDLDQLFKRLSSSNVPFGLGKTRELFETIARSERRASHYACTISAALQQGDLRSAVAIHGEAANNIGGFLNLGTSLVFKHAIQNADWEAALAVWEQYGDYRRLYLPQRCVWEDFDRLPLPSILEHASGAVSFAINCIEASSFDDAISARKLAIAIVQRALNVRHAEFDPFLQAELVDKAQSIQEPSFDLYRAAIVQHFSVGVQSSEHSQWGLRLYRTARTKPDFVPSSKLLYAVLTRCHATRSSQDMYHVLEDYRKHDIELPIFAYPRLLSQFARHGDFNTVDQLFRESIDRFGAENIGITAPCLLHACYRRAEPDRAIGVLEHLQQTYDYLPDIQGWNTLFATYARVGDCDGAMALLDRLVKVNVRPDSKTYGILMGMYAKRSDYEATSTVYEQAISEGVKPSFEMIGSLVLALAANDRLDEAERTAEEALGMDFEAPRHPSPALTGDFSRTRMWNVLLGHRAMRGELDKVFELQNRMREAGVAFDGATYAALMQSLCIKKMPVAARKILLDVMPKADIRATATHYAIVMSGYLTTKDYRMVFNLQRRMEEEGIKPTSSTRNTLLRVASQLDHKEHFRGTSKTRIFEASHADQILTQTLDNLDPIELATLGPLKFAQSNPPNAAFQASYFPYMISLYGSKKVFDKVAEMYDKYISTVRKSNPDTEISPSVELLSSLMVSYTKAGEHSETEKCWHLALSKSQEIACKANGDTSQPGWVLHKYRYLLSLPLTRYMHTLWATSRIDEIEPLISSLQRAGYRLSTHNWNKYIQLLVQSQSNSHTLLAYRLCEEKIMEGWPGWERFGHHIALKRRIKKQWVPRSWELGRPFPHYETIVYLASAYLDLQAEAYGTGLAFVGELERAAPKTVEAVGKLPRFDDKIQNTLLKRD
ncbi:MAG: hypothetical protein L6R39_007286 [Caloplaca ligustica]|nr:MAG: hypothetical protein L6R39_007286 [Caloplaca ligustica]